MATRLYSGGENRRDTIFNGTFDNTGTYFTGSYNELRDLPAGSSGFDGGLLEAEAIEIEVGGNIPSLTSSLITMLNSGNIVMNGGRITNLELPLNDTDGVNKAYVDNALGSLTWGSILQKPSWLAGTQGGVALSGFAGNIPNSRINWTSDANIGTRRLTNLGNAII